MSELGKLEAGDIALPAVTFDLTSLVTEVASNMPEGADRGIRFDVIAPRRISVAGDRTRLGAALRALMQAALRERAGPGAIVVQCSAIADGAGPWAIVMIGDESVTPELADAARAPAPPPFDEWRGGLGLGLPVGRRVIEAHGGAVWSAPANPRAGSALRLPLAPDGNGPAATRDHSGAS